MYKLKPNFTEENEIMDCAELAKFPSIPCFGYPPIDDGNGMSIWQGE